MAEQLNDPWYRHMWVWLLMIPPAAAVIGGFTTAYLAGGPPSLVVDDYGEIAMATARSATRDATASELGLAGQLSFGSVQPDGRSAIRIKIDAIASWSPPERVRLRLTHPTLEHLDRDTLLDQTTDSYRGAIERPPGRFYVEIDDEVGAWRLTGTLMPNANELTMRAVKKNLPTPSPEVAD